MNKKLFLLAMLVMVLAFGMMVVGCDDDPESGGKDALDGTTWKGAYGGYNITLKFNSPNYTLTNSQGGASETENGTYTISGDTVTLTKKSGSSTTGTFSGNTLTVQGVTLTKQ
jgi:hypothetical protein